MSILGIHLGPTLGLLGVPFFDFWSVGLPRFLGRSGDSYVPNVGRAGGALLGWGMTMIETDPYRMARQFAFDYWSRLFGSGDENFSTAGFHLNPYHPERESDVVYSGGGGGGASGSSPAAYVPDSGNGGEAGYTGGKAGGGGTVTGAGGRRRKGPAGRSGGGSRRAGGNAGAGLLPTEPAKPKGPTRAQQREAKIIEKAEREGRVVSLADANKIPRNDRPSQLGNDLANFAASARDGITYKNLEIPGYPYKNSKKIVLISERDKRAVEIYMEGSVPTSSYIGVYTEGKIYPK